MIEINEIELSQKEHEILGIVTRIQRIQLGGLYPALSPGEGHLLGELVRSGHGLTVSQLAEALNMSMPAVSRLMRGMEERNLIERKIVPQDRRSILVTITPEGLRIHGEMCRFFHAFFGELLSTFDGEEFRSMMQGIHHLVDQMEVLIQKYNDPAFLPTENAFETRTEEES